MEKVPGTLPRFPRNSFAKPVFGVFSNLEIMCGRKMSADWLDTAGAELGALRIGVRAKPMYSREPQILPSPLRAQLHGSFRYFEFLKIFPALYV